MVQRRGSSFRGTPEELRGITANSYLVVDLRKLKRNIEKLQAHIGSGVTLLPVLKAGTCGHGLEEIGAFLVEECGLSILCVGQTTEARWLRERGLDCDILVLGGTPFNNLPYAVEQGLTTTLATPEYAEELSREAVRQGRQAKVHLKINSGLGRMGVKPGAELAALLELVGRLPNLAVEGAYTHFSDSEQIDTTLTDRQAAAFDRALEQIAGAGIELKYRHASNTPAVVRFPQYHYNMVRTLLLLVGYDWSIYEKNRLGLEKIMYWRSFVTQVNTLRAGEACDYNMTVRADRDRRIAVTSFGYSDGYPEDMAGRGAFVMIHGKKAPLLSLNMDQGYVDVTDIEDVRVNDSVLLLGRDGEEEITTEELLRGTGHSEMYFMSQIMERVQRIYLR